MDTLNSITYEERLVSKIVILIFAILDSILGFITLNVFLSTSINILGTVIMLGSIGVLTFVGVNFSVLKIILTSDFIILRFGLFSKKIPYEIIEGYRLDSTPARKYGGLGIRIAKINGNYVNAYIIEKTDKIAVKLKNYKYHEIVFSTKHPYEVMNILKLQIELNKK